MLTHSISLNWLTRHFKAYSSPIVIIEESPNNIYGAYFDWDINTVIQIDDSEIFNERGIIVLSLHTTLPEETLILHEYRHSLQFEINGKWSVPNYLGGESLETYNGTIFERDARLFESFSFTNAPIAYH